jgi:Flp pilus assembly secretin CpaC
VLGRIPLLGRLFRYDDDSNELVSLVFIITPKVYDATSGDLDSANLRMQDASGVEMMDPELMPNPLLPPVSGRMRNPPSRILSPATAQQPLTPPATAAPAAPKRNLFQRLFNR